MADLYGVLGVERTADSAAIRKAYRRKAKGAHPDHGGSREGFEALKRAYDILMDGKRRAKYDETGDESDAPTSGPSSDAVMYVAQALDQSLATIEQRGGHVTEFDIVAEIRRILVERRAQPRAQRGAIATALYSNLALVGRFTVKEGGNLLEGFVNQRIAHLKDQDSACERQIAILDEAIKIVDRHQFRADASAASGRDLRAEYSDKVGAFMQLTGAQVIS